MTGRSTPKTAAVQKSIETIVKEKFAEKALILIKNDGVTRGIIGAVITEFEKRNLKVVGLKMIVPTARMIEKHYADKDSWLRSLLVDGMAEKPLIAMVVEGPNAAITAKKIVGATEPKNADPATIRGSFSTESYELSNIRKRNLDNIVHACDPTPAAAESEIRVWFNKHEIVDYMSESDKARAYDENVKLLRKDE